MPHRRWPESCMSNEQCSPDMLHQSHLDATLSGLKKAWSTSPAGVSMSGGLKRRRMSRTHSSRVSRSLCGTWRMSNNPRAVSKAAARHASSPAVTPLESAAMRSLAAFSTLPSTTNSAGQLVSFVLHSPSLCQPSIHSLPLRLKPAPAL